jgi:hypothetical protein
MCVVPLLAKMKVIAVPSTEAFPTTGLALEVEGAHNFDDYQYP